MDKNMDKNQGNMPPRAAYTFLVLSILALFFVVLAGINVAHLFVWGLSFCLPLLIPVASLSALNETKPIDGADFYTKRIRKWAKAVSYLTLFTTIALFALVLWCNLGNLAGKLTVYAPVLKMAELVLLQAVVFVCLLQILTNVVLLIVFRNPVFVYTIITCVLLSVAMFMANWLFFSMMNGI